MTTSVRTGRGSAGRHTTVDSSPRTWSPPVAGRCGPDPARMPAMTSSTWAASARVRMTGPRPRGSGRRRWLVVAEELAHDRLSTAPASCPGRRPLRGGPGAGCDGGPPWRTRGRRREVGGAGGRPRRGTGTERTSASSRCSRGFVHDVHYPAWVWPRAHPADLRSGPRRVSDSSGPRAPSPKRHSSASPTTPRARSSPWGRCPRSWSRFERARSTSVSSPWRTPSREPSATSSTVWSSTSSCGSNER